MDVGSLSRLAAGLTLSTLNGLMKRGASFFDSTFRMRSRVESHTFFNRLVLRSLGAAMVGGGGTVASSSEVGAQAWTQVRRHWRMKP